MKLAIRTSCFKFFNAIFLRRQVTILWSHWHFLFSDFGWPCLWALWCTITCALLSLACNDPQSQLWLPRPVPGPNFKPCYDYVAARLSQWHFARLLADWNPWPCGLKPDALPTEPVRPRTSIFLKKICVDFNYSDWTLCCLKCIVLCY